MKSLLFAVSIVTLSFQLNAQEICLVSADYIDGTNYIVSWEKPLDTTGLDSVYIYRMVGTEPNFTKVGSKAMEELSIFKDVTSNTMDTTKYKISFVDIAGNESALSPWHQAVVLDYSAETLFWTKYKKENQIDETYIVSYECLRDQTGLGAYTSMGIWDWAGTNSWTDQAALANPESTYYVEVVLPSCYISKANINTSRSNIKKQYANEEAGITESIASNYLQIFPNPAHEVLSIKIHPSFLNSTYSIIDLNGNEVLTGVVGSTELTVEIETLAKGAYYFNAESANQVVSKLFVKN
jgi:Secretion system C-terminal sorting domain